MVSKKYQRKSERIEKIANESFKRFSQASWALKLAEGDEYSQPAAAETLAKLSAIFWAAAKADSAATARVNLRNVASRYALHRITKSNIPTIVARIRADANR